MKFFIFFCITLLVSLAFAQGQREFDIEKSKSEHVFQKNTLSKSPITNSVLATGDWYKFYVDKTGIFKITPEFLSSLGMNISNIDPNTIKIYGNGGQMLPLRNDANFEFDLRENAIQVFSGEDGVFSGKDFILFYGEGTKAYNQDSKTHINVYEDKSFYFISAGKNKGNRVSTYDPPSKPANKTINSFVDYQFYEIDKTNIAKMGRRWFGDDFKPKERRDYTFHFPNLINESLIKFTILAAAQSAATSQFKVVLNTKDIGILPFSSKSNSTLARTREMNKKIAVFSDEIKVQLQYDVKENASGKGYLDYVSIEAERLLKGTGKQMPFSVEKSTNDQNIVEVVISNANEITEIWDITNLAEIKTIKNSGLDDSVKFKFNADIKRRFVALVQNDFYSPLKTKKTRLTNQDIKGTIFLNKKGNFEDVDYLIVAPKDMISAAIRLATYHRIHNNLNVKVVDVHEIYNEFSSGKQDIAGIRNFVRYVYENASSVQNRPKYLCLFGDASVDYKNGRIKSAGRQIVESNIIPSFESYNSFYQIGSYVSDDFFVMLDPKEGNMKPKDHLDIAVGRILANNAKSAEDAVSKIIDYNATTSYGSWRNNILLISDDIDKRWEKTIQENLNKLGDTLIENYPHLNISKVYSDAFLQESSAAGEKYHNVNKLISKKIEQGSAVVNYFGHATEDGLATEFIFTPSNAKALKNKGKYPLLITVTCLATRFDNPAKTSLGEYFFRNPEGGAVAMIATTREILSSTGINVNKQIFNYLFPKDGDPKRPSEALMQMKNNITSNGKRSIFFIGDPAMTLKIPKPRIQLTKINEVLTKRFKDTLKALSKVKLTGHVNNATGTIDKKYQGVLTTTIFDKEIQRETLANNHIKDSKGKLIKLNFKDLGPVIFKGNASIKNGKFEFEFLVPKDVNMTIGKCKINFYAKRKENPEDIAGVYQNVLLGGIKMDTIKDQKGPEINVFMDNEDFISGGVTGSSPVLNVKLYDKSGINLASGIGHSIKAVLDNDERRPILLNDYYTPEIDNFTKGEIQYQFYDLKPGLHTLIIKSWDTFNNSNTKEVQFLVRQSP